MSDLIEDLMMLADKCSEDDPADELGLLLVRAVGQIRGDAYALAAKDARIAELEGEVRRLDSGWHEANKQALEQKLASQQQADPKPLRQFIAECEARDPQMMAEAREWAKTVAPLAATPSEDGREVPEVVGVVTASGMRHGVNAVVSRPALHDLRPERR